MPHYRVDLVDGQSLTIDADRLVRDLSHTAFHVHRDGAWACMAVMDNDDIIDVHQQLTRFDLHEGWVLATPLKMVGAPLTPGGGIDVAPPVRRRRGRHLPALRRSRARPWRGNRPPGLLGRWGRYLAGHDGPAEGMVW